VLAQLWLQARKMRYRTSYRGGAWPGQGRAGHGGLSVAEAGTSGAAGMDGAGWPYAHCRRSRVHRMERGKEKYRACEAGKRAAETRKEYVRQALCTSR
jgi:hypothetical protein